MDKLREQLQGLLKELEEADSLEKAKEIKGRIDEVKAKLDLMEEKSHILDAMKATEPVQSKATATANAGLSLGQAFVKDMKGKVQRGTKFAFTGSEYCEKTDPTPTVMTRPNAWTDTTLSEIDKRIYEGYRRPLIIADLFGSESISGNAVTYFVENASVVGDFTAVAEGAKKPMISFGDPVETTETLKKVAGYYKESDEIIDDIPWLASSIDSRGLHLHGIAEETQLLNGNGTGANVNGLLNRSGIQTKTSSSQTMIDADIILDAIAAVETQTGFSPDAIVMNINDYNSLRKAKDSNLQYYGGGYFQGAYGNGQLQAKPDIWGIPTYTTPALAAGTAIVGAFKMGGSVIRKGGVTVSMYNQNEDDAIYNRVTIVVESRLALAVRYPQAFCKISYATV